MITINNQISLIPATEEPFLSSDIAFVRLSGATVIFDTGRCDASFEAIEQVEGPRLFVLSHFHKDHMTNLSRIMLRSDDLVYCGSFTAKKAADFLPVEKAVIVREPIDLGEDVMVFPIPSSHEKGSLGLRGGDIAFLGDATYAARNDNIVTFNVSLLNQTIQVMKGLPVSHFYLSHTKTGPQKKESLVKNLERIYARRKPGEAYIDVSSFDL